MLSRALHPLIRISTGLAAVLAATSTALADPAPTLTGLPRSGETPLAVLPLDDAANPWASSYSILDRELRAGAVGPEAWPTKPHPMLAGHELIGMPGHRLVWLTLDEHGWQLPLGEMARRAALERQQADRRHLTGNQSATWIGQRVACFIPQSPELDARLEAALRAGSAAAQPAVPDWLSAATPQAIIPLPDGAFITEGSPGSWRAGLTGDKHMNTADPAARHNYWQHYSASGELLGEAPLHTDPLGWLAITAPGLRKQYMTGVAQGHVAFRDGFMLVYGPVAADGSLPLSAVYDWDGTPLDPAQPLTRPGGYCFPLASDYPLSL